jgi:murein hydrolase activator
VLAYDQELVVTARSASDEARRARAEADRQRERLEETRAALDRELREGEILREERKQLLEAVRREKKSSEQLQNELLAASRRLERELGVVRGNQPVPERATGGFAAQKGRLPWPVAGRVEVPFGKKVDPSSGMVMVQKGVDLRAPFGAVVRAVFEGRVAYADWFDGFGRMLIVEHEGGFFTLYAHLERYAVEKGAQVNAHQVIGSVGDSGSTKGAYLYFELRNGREPVDPLRWLAH